jgi:hypothetical protein
VAKVILKNLWMLSFVMISYVLVYAGNPDRQGEAGAGELLFNPWARSSGLHSMNTSSVFGVEAMRINIAGLSRINKSEFVVANSRLFEGTGLGMSAVGFATRMGTNGALGISLTSLNFGDIPITTVNQPEGTGGTFSPNFFNIGLGYSYLYENKISVGFLVRAINESLPDVSASGIALDAGVQYVTGPKDNFRLGIALNNIGTPMRFGGEGLTFQGPNPDRGGGAAYQLTFAQRAERFELPSTLNIGLSYDVYFGEEDFIRLLGNFTSNAFSRDQLGAGAEFSYRNIVVFRAAYKIDVGPLGPIAEGLYTGLAAGVSFEVPMKKGTNQNLGIDYAYRDTNPFRGSHNLSLRLAF